METQHLAASTYVQITREELENWLDTIGFRGKWERDAKTAGIYLLSIGDNVAIKLSSTIGSSDDAMGRGQASMQLSLVSKITKRTLNKKAQGQSHFARTKGWMTNWERGIDTMKRAYMPSADFYETIAGIEDREKYSADMLKKIEAVPGWSTDNMMIYLHRTIERGGVLMPKDMIHIENAMRRQTSRPEPQKEPPAKTIEPEIKREEIQKVMEFNAHKVQALRDLWIVAKRANDEWTMGFAESIGKLLKANRNLTAPQILLLKKKLDSYRVPSQGDPASNLF